MGYLEGVGLQSKMGYLEGVGLQSKMGYLEGKMDYQGVAMLQSKMDYQGVAMLQSKMDYQGVAMLQSKMDYQGVAMLQSKMDYQGVAMLQSKMDYQGVAMLQSKMNYQGVAMLQSKKDYQAKGQISLAKKWDQAEASQYDILGVLAAGMKQLQEVQTKALERRSTVDPEAVKPGVTALPELKAPTPETAPVEVQDWLQLLAAPMADLSDSSGEWWMKIQELAQQSYQEWSDATPIERLSLRPPRRKELEEGKYARLNSRASSMLVASLDPQVRADLVTRRCTSSASQILFRVLTLYQPGGEAEKRLVIEQLQNGAPQPDAPKAAEALRNWERWHRRAADVGVTTPDPTILGRALTGIMKKVLEANPEAAFRTSLLRNSLKLDTRPTDETIHAYHKHLLAEAEALTTGAHRSSATSTATTEATRTSSGDRPTKLKGLQASGEAEQVPKAKASPSPSPAAASPKLCRWFAKSDTGCKRGADCQFLHDWQGVSKSGRCLICSGTGHQKKDCPTKDKNAQAQGSRTRQREQPTSTSTAPPANKALSANQEPASPSSQPASEPSPTSGTTRGPTPAEQPQQDELKQVIADASKMIKSMMAQSTAFKLGHYPRWSSVVRVNPEAVGRTQVACHEGWGKGRRSC